jgi:norsolorinic acid ketoreductase
MHRQGLGRGFVEKYLSRPNTTVVAAARNPNGQDAQDLANISKAEGSKLITVKIDSTSETDAANAISAIKGQGITHLDVVIANAGIFRSEAFLEISVAKTSDLIEHVDVNVNGPIRLFQAVRPLLKAAKQPKFAVISSGVATIAGAEHIPWAVSSYGASKAALNFVLRRIHIENPDLIAISFHPG